MIKKLVALFAANGVELDVTEETIRTTAVRRYGLPIEMIYLQERHVAQAFQEAFFAGVCPASRAAILRSVFQAEPGPNLDALSVQNAIRAHLMKAGEPAYVHEAFVGFDDACRLILALGGLPCYPVLADGTRPICSFEDPVEHLAQSLKERRVYCAELIPNRNSVAVLAAYSYALRSAGIALLAGTEHNTLEVLPMEPHCADGAGVPEPLKEMFWEGACVVAAHQFLSATGRTGYVDASGELNPLYSSGEARIEAFANLGAAVIDEYRRITAVAGMGRG